MFHPTPEEFEDPIRYVASIRAEAEPYGLCRIVPPAGWEVPFHQDPATFSFKTRIQTVNELQLRLKKGKHRGFRAEYADFMQTQGQSVTRSPVFAGRKLDLQSLYDCVASGGGFDAACSGKRWRDMRGHARHVGPSEALRRSTRSGCSRRKHKKHRRASRPRARPRRRLRPKKSKRGSPGRRSPRSSRTAPRDSIGGAADRSAARASATPRDPTAGRARVVRPRLSPAARPPPRFHRGSPPRRRRATRALPRSRHPSGSPNSSAGLKEGAQQLEEQTAGCQTAAEPRTRVR